jgi:hypothetical protein
MRRDSCYTKYLIRSTQLVIIILFFLDSFLVYQLSSLFLLGLVTSARSDARTHTLAHHKKPYAHPLPPLPPSSQTQTSTPSTASTEETDIDSIKTDRMGNSGSNDTSSSGSSSSDEVPSTLLACVERIQPTALIGNKEGPSSIINHHPSSTK